MSSKRMLGHGDGARGFPETSGELRGGSGSSGIWQTASPGVPGGGDNRQTPTAR